jgi:homoserine O-acetyltransferase
MVDALLPIASLPAQISGRNLIWRRLITESIRSDPDWQGGEYQKQPAHWSTTVPLFTIMAESALRLQEEAPTRKEAEARYDRDVAEARRDFDANDFLYWLESSWDYDPEPELGRIKAPLLAVNFADDQINPPELGILERLVAKVPRGRAVVVPAGAGTLGHQTLTQARVWKPYLEELLRSLP